MINAVIQSGTEVRPTIEVFNISGMSAAQLSEDSGWYFFMVLGGIELGDPVGPYATEEIARNEAENRTHC